MCSNDEPIKVINACWDITPRCNDRCQFCYRNAGDPELSLPENIKILKKLIDAGVKKVSFVGGEPLLYKDLFKLAEAGKRYSGSVQLSVTTNGMLLARGEDGTFEADRELISRIAERFDWVVLPLDAPDSETQKRMTRNARHFERVMFLLDYFYKYHPNTHIKINTLVTRINIDEVAALYELLAARHIRRWKLFRYLPSRGPARDNRICSISRTKSLTGSARGFPV